MTKFLKISLSELLREPKRFQGTPVEVEGIVTYIGKSPRLPVYSVNLPDEKYCIAILKSDDKEIICYGLEHVCLDEFNNARVVVKGFFVRLHDNYAIKVIEVKSKQ